MSSVWVLTEEFNDYDQHGEYLVAVFKDKPDVKTLASFLKIDEHTQFVGGPMAALDFILHLESGGGRRGTEYNWYNLRQLEYGKRFNE